MKLKIFLIATMFACINFMATSQLMQRENVETGIVKSGTRPEQGNFSFFFGPSLREIQDMTDADIDGFMLPLTNVKYYITDNMEVRLGLALSQTKEVLEGSFDEGTLGLTEDKSVNSFFRVYPSFNYHFSPKNMLDTYTGAGLIFGTEKDEMITETTYNIVGDYSNVSVSSSSFVWGFSIYEGVQTFVADLPISIGLEFGISFLKRSNMQYKHTTATSVSGVETEQVYYTKDGSSSAKYKDLDVKEFKLGSDLRLTLSYYFK